LRRLVDLADLAARWTRVVTKAAKDNMPTTPKKGKPHDDAVLASFSGFVWSSTGCMASYLRAAGGPVVQGFTYGAGVGTGTTGAGVGAGATGPTVAQGAAWQHCCLEHTPSAHTTPALAGSAFEPDGQVKLAQVGGGGVVVTVVAGVDVTVVVM